ncbi:MAG: nicotinate (nicotinamide) nucleotide adenylyltransferase [Faecalibacterium sp.]|nr:nicotinate (nicotinamide) nucleotide adenylyltransferase [Ruminococcus sp.]MCM1391596.1 nicotinate (nicotinamide) nucleotide adenylyltransferase [Ruminococcus sp.]MCM1486490.1 nicotinate (nicotinamide) nucleotide adenylyltransferase [Faecalibacterium sp.]
MSRIGIFGGTFNPPHKAHVYLAKQIKETAALDKIIVIPTFVPPHKQTHELQSGSDRLKMCRRTFTDSFFEVSAIELLRQGKSYTIDTLEEMKKRYPNDEFFLIIGSDMLLSFHKWYRYRDIISLCTLCVASREDSAGYETLCSYARDVLQLDVSNGDIIISTLPPLEMSSTSIRQKIKNGEDMGGFLTDGVIEFIKEKGFYK